jgi:hypothetical protein
MSKRAAAGAGLELKAQDMVEAGLVNAAAGPEPASAGVANRKDGTKD